MMHAPEPGSISLTGIAIGALVHFGKCKKQSTPSGLGGSTQTAVPPTDKARVERAFYLVVVAVPPDLSAQRHWLSDDPFAPRVVRQVKVTTADWRASCRSPSV